MSSWTTSSFKARAHAVEDLRIAEDPPSNYPLFGFTLKYDVQGPDKRELSINSFEPDVFSHAEILEAILDHIDLERLRRLFVTDFSSSSFPWSSAPNLKTISLRNSPGFLQEFLEACEETGSHLFPRLRYLLCAGLTTDEVREGGDGYIFGRLIQGMKRKRRAGHCRWQLLIEIQLAKGAGDEFVLRNLAQLEAIFPNVTFGDFEEDLFFWWAKEETDEEDSDVE